MPTINIWIVGAGAIGQLYGFYLSKCCKVSLFGREGHELSGPLQFQPYAEEPPLRWQPAPAQQLLGEDDLLLICCKSYQTADAFSPIAHRIAANTPLLLLQNGMGSEVQLGDLPNPILKAAITHGALRMETGIIKHTGLGSTEFGLLSGSLDPHQQHRLTRLFAQALPPANWQADMHTVLWKKLIVNAAINPLTALHGVKNGELLKPRLYPQLTRLVEEAVAVAQKQGVAIALKEMLNVVEQVAERTADNRSSMLQDVQAGRATEIDFITGYLLSKAANHQLSLPHNQALYRQLHG